MDIIGCPHDLNETAVRQIETLGYIPADIKHIFLTHLHMDHAGGLPDFPSATVHIFADELELVALYAGCRAAYYAPLNEDYGYVTVEAFLSRKPVLTTTDAGGPLLFVRDEETGVVPAPDPESAAAGIDRLWALPEVRLRDMGEAGYQRVEDITWDRVIDRLTESLA